jgi:hypothetical protein
LIAEAKFDFELLDHLVFGCSGYLNIEPETKRCWQTSRDYVA